MASTNLIELDFNIKLEITIKNTTPIVLTDLTMALLGVGQQFEQFIENETTEQHRANTELYIKEVRSGSIVVELIAQAIPVVPLLWEGGSLVEWVGHAKSVIEWLNGKLAKPPKDVSKQDLIPFTDKNSNNIASNTGGYYGAKSRWDRSVGCG